MAAVFPLGSFPDTERDLDEWGIPWVTPPSRGALRQIGYTKEMSAATVDRRLDRRPKMKTGRRLNRSHRPVRGGE
jgi:hypothetical protein